LQVQTAENGALALECLEAERFDLVFMDMQMPVMDGLEATRRIRARTDRPRIPVIAMTANAMAADRDLCLQAGMDEVLTKPVEPDRLIEAVQRWARPAAALPRPSGVEAQSASSDLVAEARPGVPPASSLHNCANP
jgi:two-component system sensor histidine kinase/response regulator